jgi:enoyl-CoA hydratase/carnithine racemase
VRFKESIMSDLIVEKRRPLVRLTLNRPEKRNAFSDPMVDGLIQALTEADSDPEVKAVVITGAGNAFCAGGDIESMKRGELRSWGMKDYLWERLQKLPLAMEAFEKPLVAAVNGPATGAGLDLALACDLRSASSNAVFVSSYVRLGLAPGFGGCWYLPRLIGTGRALELLLSGRKVTSEEALAMGMINRIFPQPDLIRETEAWIDEMVGRPLPALRFIKRLVQQGMSSTLRSHLDTVSSHDALLSLTDEHLELLKRMGE